MGNTRVSPTHRTRHERERDDQEQREEQVTQRGGHPPFYKRGTVAVLNDRHAQSRREQMLQRGCHIGRLDKVAASLEAKAGR